ncbi:triose-phosphate isomerase [Patescibacteria group bacterium]|nr:triose-phosphate isomerase [Patescibacteria group bacterium]MBU4162442.1 triose-phosphate isomerase [Patescibacteria group bacterium]
MIPLVVANWKCNPQTLAQAKKLFLAVSMGIKKTKAEVVICPPFIFIPGISAVIKSPIKLGAQDAFPQEGSFTSQISVRMLKLFGCEYAIIGHSEKRALGETDEMINKKIMACLDNDIIPIFCIGESWQERKKGKTEQVLERQLELGLKDISKFKIQNSKLTIAYEPIWAIGTGNACDLDKAREAKALIRKNLAMLYGKTNAQKIRIIYGGSTNPDNALGFVKEAGMDGLLSGGASLDPRKFIAILSKF